MGFVKCSATVVLVHVIHDRVRLFGFEFLVSTYRERMNFCQYPVVIVS